ncbi:MAG: fused MFS/spermidine synthase [Fibrobacter sp.]|nr:fused MFS/spermidine synthase [Fibrobacter sp.]
MSSEVIVHKSKYNKRLEVRWEKGKKLLDTPNTNYSYGTLVDVLKFGLNKIPLKQAKNALILGFGAGSIVEPLRYQYGIKGEIVGVEIDPVVIEIAETEFGISPQDDLQIIQDDVWDFVQRPQSKFDLIIIDIFIDLKVPDKFYRQEFWQRVKRLCNDNAFVLFNAGIDLSETFVEKFADTIPEEFVYQIAYNVLKTNTLISLQKVF